MLMKVMMNWRGHLLMSQRFVGCCGHSVEARKFLTQYRFKALEKDLSASYSQQLLKR